MLFLPMRASLHKANESALRPYGHLSQMGGKFIFSCTFENHAVRLRQHPMLNPSQIRKETKIRPS